MLREADCDADVGDVGDSDDEGERDEVSESEDVDVRVTVGVMVSSAVGERENVTDLLSVAVHGGVGVDEIVPVTSCVIVLERLRVGVEVVVGVRDGDAVTDISGVMVWDGVAVSQAKQNTAMLVATTMTSFSATPDASLSTQMRV